MNSPYFPGKLLLFWMGLLTAKVRSDTGGFLFTAPRTLTSGISANDMCIYFKNQTQGSQYAITVKILRPKENVEIVSFTKNSIDADEGGECFKMSVPETRLKSGRLQLVIQSKTEGDFNVNYIEQIFIRPNPDLTFIQTDKPVYIGGQSLRFRVFCLNADLTPATEPIDEIWVENPKGVRLAQWLNETCHEGIIGKTYPLSDEPATGTWSIKLKKSGGEIFGQHFLVENYVLPRFSVSIESPEYMNATGNVTVCAKYLFGTPVQGEVQLRYFVKCSFSYYCRENESLVSLNSKLNEDGCFRFEIFLRNLSTFARHLLVNASVTESGTSKKAAAFSAIEIKTWKMINQLKFSPETRKIKFKPGLPFQGEVIAPSDANAERYLTVCLNVNDNRKCRFIRTQENKARFLILPLRPINDSNVKIFLEAWLSNKSSLEPNEASKLNLVPWYSPSGSYIRLEKSSSGPLKCNEIEKFHIFYSSADSPINFRYMVKSRGRILESKILPEKSRTTFYGYGENENPINQGDVSRVKVSEFNLTVSHSWSPRVRILIYHIRDDGEIVADTLVLAVEKCLPNRVRAQWRKSVVKPGSNNRLRIEASDSLCALTIADKSLKLLSSSSDTLSLDKIFSKFEANPAASPGGHAANTRCGRGEEVVSAEKNMSFELRQMDSSFFDSFLAFNDFEALTITDLKLETRPCREKENRDRSSVGAISRNSGADIAEMKNALTYDDEENTEENADHNDVLRGDPSHANLNRREFFPEIWIWDLVRINDSGTVDLDFDVPDSVTEWTTEIVCSSKKNGLGMMAADDSTMTTFKPFFVDFAVPHSLRKKEIFHMVVTVFNYESAELPVKIIYNPSPSFVSKSEDFAIYCVKPNGKIVHRFILEAVKLGEAHLMVTAEIDSDLAENCGNIISGKRDEIRKKTVIRHEGFPKEEVQSALICGNNSDFQGKVRWNIRAPPEAVESSISLKALVSADILAPTLLNVERLIALPTGCGEQNMMLVVPNILLLDYLLSTKINDLDLAEKALKNLDLGYQKQLNYKRRDNSYSAFGDDDGSGSLWLTAFTVRYLSQARKYVFVDSEDLNSSVSWITRQQLENGCFPMIGKIYHRNSQEKFLEENSFKTLSAYALISLLESGVSKNDSVIKNAIYCLKAAGGESLGTYGDLMSAYALISAGEYREAQAIMLEALKEANRSYGLLWWDSGESIESSIEMTAYGILTLVKLGGPHFMAAASDALRWIIQYRNQNGGFLSTQDTIVALEALSKFSATLPDWREHDRLTIAVRTPEKSRHLNVSGKNRMVQQEIRLPSFTANVVFESTGRGCALVQTSLHYNVKKSDSMDKMKIQVKIHSVSDIDSNSIARIHVCVRYDSSDDGKIGMAVLEIFMVSGYFPDRSSLYDIRTSRKGVRKWEEYENKVNFYFEDLTRKKVCVKFLVVREACVENTAPSIIRLYDYYNRRHQSSVKYNIESKCQNDIPPGEEDFGVSLKNAESKRELNGDYLNVDGDLETPSGREGVMPAYALPPKKVHEQVSDCPHCENFVPALFSRLYCSSGLAVKARVVDGRGLQFHWDVSPRKNLTVLKGGAPVAVAVKTGCECPILDSANAYILLMVLPSRSFIAADRVQEIKADDSVQIYPWGNPDKIPKYLTSAIQDCQKWSRHRR